MTRVNYCDNFDDRWLQERRMTHLWAWLMITLKWLWLRGIIIIRNKAMMPMIDDLMIMATITLPSTLCPVKKMLEGLSRTTWKFSKLDSLVKHNLSSHCQTMPLKTLATCAIISSILGHLECSDFPAPVDHFWATLTKSCPAMTVSVFAFICRSWPLSGKTNRLWKQQWVYLILTLGKRY